MSTDRTDAQTVAEIAAQAAAPDLLDPDADGSLVALADGYGKTRIVDLEEYASEPRRAKAERTVYDAGSFARYLDRHGSISTEAFADLPTARVVAILDSHVPGRNGWQGHRITLQLTHSQSWVAWATQSGKLLPQQDFAELIELQAADVRDPDPADLLDLAQHFEAAKSVDFESSERLADGQTRLRYVETVTAKAGQKGDLVIPDSIVLGLRPYIGGPAYRVVARFRYRIGPDRQLRLGYTLDRPQAVVEAAFEDVVVALRDGGKPAPTEAKPNPEPTFPPVQAPIYLGRP